MHKIVLRKIREKFNQANHSVAAFSGSEYLGKGISVNLSIDNFWKNWSHNMMKWDIKPTRAWYLEYEDFMAATEDGLFTVTEDEVIFRFKFTEKGIDFYKAMIQL